MCKSIVFFALLTIVIPLNLAIDTNDNDRRELPTDDDNEEVTKSLEIATTISVEDALFNEIIDSWKEKYKGFKWDGLKEYIFKERAKTLGVNPLDHLKSCEHPILFSMFGLDSPFTIVKQFVDGWNGSLYDKYSIDFFDIRYNESSQILELLEQKSPDDFKMFNEDLQLFKTKYFDKLDPTGQKYIQKVGGGILKALVVLTFSTWGGYIPQNMNERLEDRGDWQLLMSYSEYNGLPQSAKDNIERVFCAGTALDMYSHKEHFSSFLIRIIALYKDEMRVINENRKDTIYKDEAAKLGITTMEHREISHLVASINQLISKGYASRLTTFDNWSKVYDEHSSFSETRFNKSSEIIKTVRLRFPNMWAILDKGILRFRKSSMDNITRAFIRNVGEGILENIVLQFPPKAVGEQDKIMEKLITEYSALPKTSKDDLERIFCVHTTMRIEKGEQRDFSAILEYLKNTNIVDAMRKFF